MVMVVVVAAAGGTETTQSKQSGIAAKRSEDARANCVCLRVCVCLPACACMCVCVCVFVCVPLSGSELGLRSQNRPARPERRCGPSGAEKSPGRERDRVQRERSGVKKEWDRATLLRCSLGGLVAGRQPAPAPARWAACQSRGIRRAQRRGLARRRQSRGSDLNSAAGPRVPARQGPLKPPPPKATVRL